MEDKKLKGVVAEISENGKKGLIKCGGGEDYVFESKDLAEGYKPVLKDIVEFNFIDERPSGIALYYREKGVPEDPRDVDVRVKCPNCGAMIMPKAQKEKGNVVRVYCPKCNKLLEEFDRPPSTSIWMWLLAIILGIIVGGIVFYMYAPYNWFEPY
ncbi:MAG: zinc ribbon domain-containing protein [Burkholderiales bacterium]|nr:zinc ribbon domain-containing protein [Burkholderiales bacterium]